MKKPIDIVILTEDRYINPSEINAYNKNVLLEDKILQDALVNEGLSVTRKSWSDPEFNWSSSKYVIFRTTWDYFDRYTEFSNWLNKIHSQTVLLNSQRLIEWNIDKHYLKDLQQQDIHCCETHFIEQYTNTTLKKLHEQLDWKHTVLKPCVSGAARHTYQLNTKNIALHEAIFSELITNEAMMLQPFQHNIITKGEYSYIIIDGVYTHAVQKIAKKGDFRVQDDFGGTVHKHNATAHEIAFAERAVAACIEKPLYARVDVIIDNNNSLAISELELIEPELWFRNNPNAATQLAKAIALKNK